MEEQISKPSKIATLRVLTIGCCSSFVLGAVISAMATSILFLTAADQVQPLVASNQSVPLSVSQSASASIHEPNPFVVSPLVPLDENNRTQPAIEMSRAETLMELFSPNASTITPALTETKDGLSGGGFFLGDKIVPYVIPLEDNKDVIKAKNILVEKLKDMPSIKVGDGNNRMYVIFDPICPFCHKTWELQMAENWSKKHNLTIHWIPANYFFQQKQSAIASIYILSLLVNNRQEDAFDFVNNLNTMSDKKPAPIENQEEIIEQVVDHLNNGTMAMIQTGQRLPTVIIPSSKSESITAITGLVESFEIEEALAK